jgi:negative regulator of replication initiation
VQKGKKYLNEFEINTLDERETTTKPKEIPRLQAWVI